VRTQAALLQEQAAAAQQATVMTGAIVRQYQIADGVCQAWQRASADTAAAAAEERIPPVALLVHELSEHRPDGVWLRRIEIDGSRMELQGGATGQATLDTYLQQLSRSPYLDSIRLTTCQQADDAGRAYEFAVVAQVKRG
jgi:Tfp pilus assembly protein PilN